MSGTDEAGGLSGGESVEMANEFAVVQVRRVATHNGVRLEIVSPRLGRGIRLDPVELETLTWQSHETFTGFLQTPFGPEPAVEADAAAAHEDGAS